MFSVAVTVVIVIISIVIFITTVLVDYVAVFGAELSSSLLLLFETHHWKMLVMLVNRKYDKGVCYAEFNVQLMIKFLTYCLKTKKRKRK